MAGIKFDNVGEDWVCRICGLVVNYRSREVLRKSVRKRHTVSRCAEGLLTQGEEAKEKAIAKARNVDQKYLKLFWIHCGRPCLLQLLMVTFRET